MMHPHLLTAAAMGGPYARQRLLKAATALLALRGLATVTVEEICLAAGVSKGGFYHHFPEKESAFLEVALAELRGEMNPPRLALDGPRGHDASALLLDLWAWGGRRPRARRLIRTIHRRAFRQLLKPPRGQPAGGTPFSGDREARAALTLALGIGAVVERATEHHLSASERQRQKKAAAG